MYPTRLIRTAAFRLTVAYAGAFVLLVLLLLLATYVGVTQFIKADLRGAIDREQTELRHLFRQSSPEALAAAVQERRRRAAEEGLVHLLQTPAGEVMAGRLPVMPAIEGWHDIIPPGEDDDEPFLGLGALLEDGHYLLIAADAEAIHDLREITQVGSAWTLTIALPLALVGGFVMSAMTLRRIEIISETTNHIRDGNLAERVPLAGTGDEFDRLASSINGMLDAIHDLTRGIHQVSNDIAHDLRTPLTRLQQGLETAKRRASERDDFETAIDNALDQTATILSMFDALLRIGQIEAGTRRAKFAEQDLSKLFRCLIDTYETVAAGCHKQLKAEISDGLSAIGDHELLTLMVANLIENALEHTPEGAEVDVKLGFEHGQIQAIIGDNGPGIPLAEREKVFRHFYRLDASRHTPGSGLGLSIVAAIAKLHQIEIELADNAPGLRVVLAFSDAAAGSSGD